MEQNDLKAFVARDGLDTSIILKNEEGEIICEEPGHKQIICLMSPVMRKMLDTEDAVVLQKNAVLPVLVGSITDIAQWLRGDDVKTLVKVKSVSKDDNKASAESLLEEVLSLVLLTDYLMLDKLLRLSVNAVFELLERLSTYKEHLFALALACPPFRRNATSQIAKLIFDSSSEKSRGIEWKYLLSDGYVLKLLTKHNFVISVEIFKCYDDDQLELVVDCDVDYRIAYESLLGFIKIYNGPFYLISKQTILVRSPGNNEKFKLHRSANSQEEFVFLPYHDYYGVTPLVDTARNVTVLRLKDHSAVPLELFNSNTHTLVLTTHKNAFDSLVVWTAQKCMLSSLAGASTEGPLEQSELLSLNVVSQCGKMLTFVSKTGQMYTYKTTASQHLTKAMLEFKKTIKIDIGQGSIVIGGELLCYGKIRLLLNNGSIVTKQFDITSSDFS